MSHIRKEVRHNIFNLYFTTNPPSQREIARELNISVSTVNYWIQRYRDKDIKKRDYPLLSVEEKRENKLKQKQAKRKDPNFHAHEVEMNRKRRKLMKFLSEKEITKTDLLTIENNKFQKVADKFFKAAEDIPIHKCFCCDRLCFKNSIRTLSKEVLFSKEASEEFIQLTYYHDIGNVGQFCKTCYNDIIKLKVPKYAVSNGFKFPEIPECLKELSLPEERLLARWLPFMQIHGCQLNLEGSVVNIPISLDTSVNQLPRNLDESYIIYVKLKKQLINLSDYMYENINPEKVFKAAEYLVQQELYIENNISLSKDWYKNVQDKNFDVDHLMIELEIEDWVNSYPTHTLITQDTDITSSLDNCFEELAFPTIYCGKTRRFKTKPTYTKIANSEIRRSDRRAARPDHLLYAYYKFSLVRLLNAINSSIRKKKLLEGSLTTELILNESCVENLISHSEGYNFMKNIKNSPAYWEKEKKRVLAAIRQWGVPTLFLTISAADTHWFPLIRALALNVDNYNLTEDEFNDITKFPYAKKCELIQKDPVTCTLYFEYRFRELVKTWKSCYGPFGKYKLKYSYYRVKFQHRGSPYIHMFLWLEGAPSYNSDTVEECEKFIDEIISCSSRNLFANYQTCHQTSTEYNKNSKKEGCRTPHFPMDRTRIIDPINEDDPRRDALKVEYESLCKYLFNISSTNNHITFNEFLKSLNLSIDRYIDIIKSGIPITTVCLKRDVKEIMINSYSPKILNLMQSHMDIQFITDIHACAAYVVDNIDKSQRVMSTLLQNCIKDCFKNGGSKLREALEKVKHAFSNASEVCAQEATWSLLKLPMSKLSVNDIFIPTFPPRQRTRRVKGVEKLKGLPNDSSDIFEWSIFDKYSRRPIVLESLCLADFATGYEFRNTGEEQNKLLNSNIYVQERRIRKILRFVNYKQPIIPDEYYREQITLFTCWRDENVDILTKNFKVLFEENQLTIAYNRQKYITLDIEEFADKLRELDNESEIFSKDENLDCNEPLEFEDEFKIDIRKENTLFKMTKRWKESTYLKNIRNATKEQVNLLTHLIHLTFKNSEPYHIFVTGPAGSGKSYLISLLDQTLMRLYQQRDSDSSVLTVLKVALTGKAAYNIKGSTLHTALGLPMKMSSPLPNLSPSTLNEYRALFQNVKTIMIDEISMISRTMLCCIDQRLRQITGVDKLFGNLNVICFGDLRQLPPVAGTPVYRIPHTNKIDILAGKFLWERFQFYELTEIVRQKSDPVFAECLNRVADGTMTAEDIALIRSRVVQDPKTIPSSAIHLFYSNAEVDAYNAEKMKQLETEGCEVVSHDTGAGRSHSKKSALIKVGKMRRCHTSNLVSKIQLKIDAKYMLVYNVNTADGLVNGAIGVLKKIEYGRVKKSGERVVQRIWIEFDDEDIGRNVRREYRRLMRKQGVETCRNWTPIERVRKIVHPANNSSLSVSREQFPVAVSEALTIHKSQGSTYKECAVHLPTPVKRELMYVGLSRVTSANGLYIVGEFVPPKRGDDRLSKELTRLRSNPLVPIYGFLQNRDDDFAGIQFLYHNVEGLSTLLEDILADPCFMGSDLIFLAETETIYTDYFKIPGFRVAGVVDSNETTRRKAGVITYIRDSLIDPLKNSFVMYSDKVQILFCYILRNIRFGVLYASPEATIDFKLEYVIDTTCKDEERKTVGNFNIKFDTEDGREFAEALKIVDLDLRTNSKHSTTRDCTLHDCI